LVFDFLRYPNPGGGGGGGEEGEEEECNPNATTFGGKSLQNFDTRF
jgi:hypothetical protein